MEMERKRLETMWGKRGAEWKSGGECMGMWRKQRLEKEEKRMREDWMGGEGSGVRRAVFKIQMSTSLTHMPVFGFVHLTVHPFTNLADDVEDIDTSLAPVTTGQVVHLTCSHQLPVNERMNE